MTTTIKIYPDGIKVNGGGLIRCTYAFDNPIDRPERGCSIIIIADAGKLPTDIFNVEPCDAYIDYSGMDSAVITRDHPLYYYVWYAAYKTKVDSMRASIARGVTPWAYATRMCDLFKAYPNPGQPSDDILGA